MFISEISEAVGAKFNNIRCLEGRLESLENVLRNWIVMIQGSTLVLAPLPRASRICKLQVKGKWKLHLACPTGKCTVYISGLLRGMFANFVVCHPSLSYKICFHMPAPCSTWFWMKHKRYNFWRAGESWGRASESRNSLALPDKSP